VKPEAPEALAAGTDHSILKHIRRFEAQVSLTVSNWLFTMHFHEKGVGVFIRVRRKRKGLPTP